MKRAPQTLTSSLVVLCTPEVLGKRLAKLLQEYELERRVERERDAVSLGAVTAPESS